MCHAVLLSDYATVKMTRKHIQPGYTLVEMLVVTGIMVLLFAIGVPAVRVLVKSFETGANLNRLIGTALANSRAIAARDETYAGVRFQVGPDDRQYMILIEYDYDATGLANGFRAVPNRRPIKLPDNTIVMDLWGKEDYTVVELIDFIDQIINADGRINNDQVEDEVKLRDTMTFSIVFSKSGRLVTHDVRVRNRDGEYKSSDSSTDDIFNTKTNVDNSTTDPAIDKGLFYQDDYPEFGLWQESSRNNFVVCDKKAFEAVAVGKRWSGYLKDIEVSRKYVNPHSGEIIDSGR